MKNTTLLGLIAILASLCVACQSPPPQEQPNESLGSIATIVLEQDEPENESEGVVKELSEPNSAPTNSADSNWSPANQDEAIGSQLSVENIAEDQFVVAQPQMNEAAIDEFAAQRIPYNDSPLKPISGVEQIPVAELNDEPLDQGYLQAAPARQVTYRGPLNSIATSTIPSPYVDNEKTPDPEPVVVVKAEFTFGTNDPTKIVGEFDKENVRTSLDAINIVIATTPQQDAANLEVTVTHDRVTSANIPAASGAYPIPLKEGVNTLMVNSKPDGKLLASTVITKDKTGPILQSAQLIADPKFGNYLNMRFQDADWLKDSVTKDAFYIKRKADGTRINPQGKPVIDGRYVNLYLPELAEGAYDLKLYHSVPRDPAGVTVLKDIFQNTTKDQTSETDDSFAGQRWQFTATGGRKFGQQVPFPQYAPPRNEDPENRQIFNPGDFVETRVMRLYYFRDAHRVAQVINRNIRSLNRAAVEQAQRRAESARDKADNLTDSRRKAEREAVMMAQEARATEKELARVQQAIPQLRELQKNIAQLNTEITAKAAENPDLAGDIKKMETGIDEKKTDIEGQKTDIENKRKEIQLNSESEVTQRQIDSLQQQIEVTQKQIQKNKDIKFIQNEIAERKVQRDSPGVSDEKKQELQQEIDDRNAKLAILNEELVRLKRQTEPDPMQEQLDRLQNQLSRLNSKVASTQNPTDSPQVQLATLQRGLETMKNDFAKMERELVTLTTQTAAWQAEYDALQYRLENLKDQALQFGADPADVEGSISRIIGNIGSMQQGLARAREDAIRTQEAALSKEAEEDRARENQFRQEVSAAHEDPDTFVAGDINSVDPVTQCSLSVIGEGLIQIRGPIKGINKVRTMINQIDSPLGQVKIGINTIQVNGEKGDRMEKVVARIESYVDLGRFLTSQSLLLMRKAIQETAGMIAQQSEQGGHYQVDRDRKYLYAFFGRDFIDELYAMDSEFLNSENKILSLHSMDTISLNRALFIMALAKNDVREQIMARFMELVQCELPEAEWDFRRSSGFKDFQTKHKFLHHKRYNSELHTLQDVICYAQERYHFRNFRGFFDTGVSYSDTMNPVQREFIRLAQIFKSQMVAEIELKQRIIERALIQDPSGDEGAINAELKNVQKEALKTVGPAYLELIEVSKSLDSASIISKEFGEYSKKMELNWSHVKSLNESVKKLNELGKKDAAKAEELYGKALFIMGELTQTTSKLFEHQDDALLEPSIARMLQTLEWYETNFIGNPMPQDLDDRWDNISNVWEDIRLFTPVLTDFYEVMASVDTRLQTFRRIITDPYSDPKTVKSTYDDLVSATNALPQIEFKARLTWTIDLAIASRLRADAAEAKIEHAEYLTNRTRAKLDHRKLLNFLIDEQEEKYIELVEGTRSHIATIDNYLKRLSIALEDDFKIQFYDPAWAQIRGAAREHDVNLGQVEKTTILTNNRAFAKVSPQATMEFDLPKRKIAIVEALDGAKALAQDYGALLNDPTFLAAFDLMGGAKQATSVKSMTPGLPTSTDQHEMGQVSDPAKQSDSALQGLVPDPEIYKFETGTGFEIRPVIQPDGDSIIYDFNYMYTTNVREPVAADEKHLGRIKRHFIDTQVQTSSFELREVSRYQVALKASRTGKGVPGFENIPGVGALFRPAPSAESSLQQNIILGSSTVYPTLFDLMGLRWAPHVVDLDHINLLDTEHVVRGRKNTIRDHVFEEASRRVDKFLHLRRTTPQQYRPDLYHEQRAPSRYHPNGYTYPEPVVDPSGREFQRIDRRPPEWQQDPPYDMFRPRPVQPESIQNLIPIETGEAIPASSMSGHKQANFRMPIIEGPVESDGSYDPRIPAGNPTYQGTLNHGRRAQAGAPWKRDQ